MSEGDGVYVFILPLEWIVFVLGLILLMINAESFFFKIFGIKWSKSDSEKFLMAKDYMKRGIIIIIIAGLMIAVTFVLIPMGDENIDSTEDVMVQIEHKQRIHGQDE